MKKAFLALLLLVGAAATVANAQEEGMQTPNGPLLRKSLAEKSQSLRTSAASDSTFVGHSHTNHYNASTNPWNIYIGTLRPNANLANEAAWDFEDQTGLGVTDSLQGLWPVAMPYRYGGAVATFLDYDRPWACIDHGNQVNYRPLHTGAVPANLSNLATTRTFGVTGVWHADPGKGTAGTVQALVRWTPLAGSQSAWCGLRALGDNSVSDAATGNPYNEQAGQYNIWAANTSPAPIFRNYPGYANQWDQILFRDFQAANNTAMNVAFLYRTALSTSFSTSATGRCGWYHGDPLSQTNGLAPGAGFNNFISSSGSGANAPRDSFSVYIGVPVNDASVHLTDGSTDPVFDKQRRWFDEVIRIDAPYFEILGATGTTDTTLAPASYSAAIPFADPGNGDAYIGAIYNFSDNAAHKVRLAFRLKTNRAFSDEDYKSGSGTVNGGYTSNGFGGVQIDNVNVDGAVSNFESAGDINNLVNGSGNYVSDASSSWKSTGKPEPTYCHAVNTATAHWEDICGDVATPTSQCSIGGIAVSVGNADRTGMIGDDRWPAMTEWVGGIISPTVSLVTTGTVTPNEMGLTGNLKQATDDILVNYDINFAAFVLSETGTLWNYGIQNYPALTANGHFAWSDVTGSPFRIYNSFAGCQPDIENIKSNAMIHTSNADGIPDSMRLYMGITSESFALGGFPNSTAGGYFDQISLCFSNLQSPDPVGSIGSDIWQFFNDAFPVNGYSTDNVGVTSAAFDTTTALVKGAINNAPNTGDLARFDVLADSVTVSAPNGNGTDPIMRVDLVFRILPGPGNYGTATARAFPPTTTMQLLKVPTNQGAVAASGDGSFWGEYIANPGQFSSPGAHSGGKWDYLAWNSARCDTVGGPMFPVVGKATEGVDANGNTYQTTMHELDPHYEKLGIQKAICFLIDATQTAQSSNISCDSTANKGGGLLVNYLGASGQPGSADGFNGRWTTKEYTKVIPDGLLTPGSHVQYFWRKQRNDLTGSFVMDPDTTTISPQFTEGSFDGERWQHFAVLPDRWKHTGFGGDGMACMLYIDNNDRRGDERIWVSVMDSIGGTKSTKWGAHNGWHATGAGFSLNNVVNANVSQAFVRNKNAQPGTVWDMYQVKASESASTMGSRIGNRYATQPTGLLTGKGVDRPPQGVAALPVHDGHLVDGRPQHQEHWSCGELG